MVPEFLPPTPDRLSRRAGGLEQLTCDEVKKAKIYFPGYRALVRGMGCVVVTILQHPCYSVYGLFEGRQAGRKEKFIAGIRMGAR